VQPTVDVCTLHILTHLFLQRLLFFSPASALLQLPLKLLRSPFVKSHLPIRLSQTAVGLNGLEPPIYHSASLYIPTTARRISCLRISLRLLALFPGLYLPLCPRKPTTLIDVNLHGRFWLLVACALGGLEEDWLGAVCDKLHYRTSPSILPHRNKHSHRTRHVTLNRTPLIIRDD
jgi:hypothetical protein